MRSAIWMASGPFLSLASTWHHMAGAAWIPWVVLAADMALTRPSVAFVIDIRRQNLVEQLLYKAIFAYNHADWYVQMVVHLADKIAAKFHETPPVAVKG